MSDQLQKLKAWIHDNDQRLLECRPSQKVGHEIIDTVAIFDHLVSKIKVGNLNAIEICCDFLAADFKTPFGKITKSHMINAMRGQEAHIDKSRKALLSILAIKYIGLPSPPQEAKDLMKLVKAFDKRYVLEVIQNSNPVSDVGKKHIEYLQSKS